MSRPMSVVNLAEVEETLKDYRFLKTPIRAELDVFFTRLREPYRSFAKLRYQDSCTMEEVAEELGYSTRTVYNYRKKVLKWWVLFQTGKRCS